MSKPTIDVFDEKKKRKKSKKKFGEFLSRVSEAYMSLQNQTVIDCSGDNANSTQCVQQIQAAADLAFAMSLAINVGIFLVVMFIFMLVRKHFQWCYEPLSDPVRETENSVSHVL
jgi:hypothetical protein